jgi:hypothetical protein
MKIDLQKGAKNIGTAMEKAAVIGKKTADGTIAGAQSIVAKAQEENQKSLLKKYNPVFPEQYKSDQFAIPNLVMIVDDAVRRDVDVCKGSIGWRSNQKGVEIFCLYDEAIDFSGLNFIPAAVCDSVYYVDPFDKTRFVRLDCYFDKMQESRLAELQKIAYALGAKRYSVTMEDASSEKSSLIQKASARASDHFGVVKGKADTTEERSVASERESQRKSVAHADFSGERQPTVPELKWFAHDDNIKNLIEMRCSGKGIGDIKTYTLVFKGSDFATIGANTAARIDGAMGKISAGSDFKMQSKVTKESHHNLVFQIEF